jgi:hypothetical protein
MGVEEKKLTCTRVFQLVGPKGGLCVGFSMEAPPQVPPFDTIRLCIQGKEDIEKMKKSKSAVLICSGQHISAMTAEEAMRLGASLIQAAGFYAATVDHSLKGGFYANKWEAPKPK